MSEKNFWNFLRNNLGLKMYRVENRVGVGMPDVHYISEKSSGWIELKYVSEYPKKGRGRVGFRRTQQFWHRDYSNHGGKSWILIRVGRDSIFLIDGKNSERLLKGPSKSDMWNISDWVHIGNLGKEHWEQLRSIINETESKENIRSIGESK